MIDRQMKNTKQLQLYLAVPPRFAGLARLLCPFVQGQQSKLSHYRNYHKYHNKGVVSRMPISCTCELTGHCMRAVCRSYHKF